MGARETARREEVDNLKEGYRMAAAPQLAEEVTRVRHKVAYQTRIHRDMYGIQGQKTRAAFWGAGKAILSTILAQSFRSAFESHPLHHHPASGIYPQTSEYCSWSGSLRPLASQSALVLH